MTVNEVRLDLISQGFVLIEKKAGDSVQLELHKVDTDGLQFHNVIVLNKVIMFEASDNAFIDMLKDLATSVSETIVKRHGQNINNCEHQEIMVGTKKSCLKCMGKFGERMNVDFNWN